MGREYGAVGCCRGEGGWGCGGRLWGTGLVGVWAPFGVLRGTRPNISLHGLGGGGDSRQFGIVLLRFLGILCPPAKLVGHWGSLVLHFLVSADV